MFGRPAFMTLQVSPRSGLFSTPLLVAAYTVLGTVGSIASAWTCAEGRLELQTVPSVVLNTPSWVPAYAHAASVGSMASAAPSATAGRLVALQFVPPSLLLNTPRRYPVAYSVW